MQFVVKPDSPTPPAPSPVSKPVAAKAQEFAPEEPKSSADFSGFKKRSSIDKYRANNEGLRPATSWLDIFDWKFEKYLTPWVVRATWIFCLFMAGLWLLFLFLSTIASFFPPEDLRPIRNNAIGSLLQALPLVRSLDPKTLLVFVRIFGFLAVLIWVTFSLVWVRVILEGFIVMFNISTSLKSIDEKTEDRQS